MKHFDILGYKLSFFYQDREQVKTSFGGFITVLVGIILVFLIIGFGEDFFYRKNPSVVKSTQVITETILFPITNRNFTYAFRLEDSYGNLFNRDDLFQFEISYNYYVRDNGEFVTINSNYMPF